MPTQKKRSVIAIITDKNQRLLLIKRRDIPVWVLPGGGVDAGESPEEAVVREVYEETGIKVVPVKHVALYTPINRLSNDTYVYQCKHISGSPSIGSETAAIAYFPVNELPKTFFFLHHQWVLDSQKNLPHLIQKPISQVTYLELLKYFCKHPIIVMRLILSRIGLPINSR